MKKLLVVAIALSAYTLHANQPDADAVHKEIEQSAQNLCAVVKTWCSRSDKKDSAECAAFKKTFPKETECPQAYSMFLQLRLFLSQFDKLVADATNG